MSGEHSRLGRLVKAAQLLFCRLVNLRKGCSEASRWVTGLDGRSFPWLWFFSS